MHVYMCICACVCVCVRVWVVSVMVTGTLDAQPILALECYTGMVLLKKEQWNSAPVIQVVEPLFGHVRQILLFSQ